MSASTNATRVFWGTAWTSRTLLAQQLRRAREAEKRDGVRRVFRLNADDVAAEVAAYRRHVEETVQRLGRAHPTVRTQYYSEEVDGEGGMFPPDRLARMRSDETAEEAALPGKHYALLLDVAGEDEGVRGSDGILSPANPARDSSALTIVRVELPAEGSPLPRYILVKRVQWTGVSHTRLHTEIRELALTWQARTVVVDATGVGAGLTSFLERSLPGRVLPFTFNAASKSKLGWDFLGVVDSGRWREPQINPERQPEQARCQQEYLEQLAACQFQVGVSPEQRMRWGVPEGARDPQSGQPVHDDWVLSAALCACLEEMDWSPASPSLIIPGSDPLDGMEGKF